MFVVKRLLRSRFRMTMSGMGAYKVKVLATLRVLFSNHPRGPPPPEKKADWPVGLEIWPCNICTLCHHGDYTVSLNLSSLRRDIVQRMEELQVEGSCPRNTGRTLYRSPLWIRITQLIFCAAVLGTSSYTLSVFTDWKHVRFTVAGVPILSFSTSTKPNSDVHC